MNTKRIATLVTYPFNRYGTCMFAITNRCNGKCSFCAIPKQPNNQIVSLEAAKQALDKLHSLGVRYIQFTGGEPLIYPHLFELISHGNKLGMLMTLVTNSSLLDDNKIERLGSIGLQGITISVDHPDSTIHDANRGIKGLSDQIERSVKELRKVHLPVQASTTISSLLDINKGDYERLVEINQKRGFNGTYFCYPMVEMNSNYTIGGDIVRYNQNVLRKIITHILSLKSKGYPIDNSVETLRDVLAFLEGKSAKYPCVAGYKVFYLDWNLILYNCMTQGQLIGELLDIDPQHFFLSRNECNNCILSCDREPSIYQHGFKSITPFLTLVSDVIRRRVRF